MILRAIGIDFGTSTSVVRVLSYENNRPMTSIHSTDYVHFDNKSSLPSLIHEAEDGTILIGYNAESANRKGTLHSNFKMDLLIPQKREEAIRLTRLYYQFLFDTYQKQTSLFDPCDEERTYISYPAKWPEDLRRILIQIAGDVGFQNVQGIDEPTAALQTVLVCEREHLRFDEYDTSHLLMIDMGAGTTDLVLCRYAPFEEKPLTVLKTWPNDQSDTLFGGSEIDHALCRYLRNYFESAVSLSLPRFESMHLDKCKAWKESNVSLTLSKKDGVVEYCGFVDNLLDMQGIDHQPLHINRSMFEKLLSEYLPELPMLVNQCLEQADFSPDNLDNIILTGGHSQWYFVKDILTKRLTSYGTVNLPRIQEDESRIISMQWPQETVALGMAFQPMNISFEQRPSQLTSALLHVLSQRCMAKYHFDFMLDLELLRRAEGVIKREQRNLHSKHEITIDIPYFATLPDKTINIHETIAEEEVNDYLEQSMQHCPRCAAPRTIDALFCDNCGLDFRSPASAAKRCPSCGEQAAQDDLFCTHCGRSITDTTPVPEGDPHRGEYALLIKRNTSIAASLMTYHVDIDSVPCVNLENGQQHMIVLNNDGKHVIDIYYLVITKKVGFRYEIALQNNAEINFKPDISGGLQLGLINAQKLSARFL